MEFYILTKFIYWTLCLTIAFALSEILLTAIGNGFPIAITASTASNTIAIDYPTFVSIMLTGVSIILAALGFVVALLAFIGWNSIGDRVSSLAKTYLQAALHDGGELHTLVKNEAKEIIYRGVEPIDTDYSDEDSA